VENTASAALSRAASEYAGRGHPSAAIPRAALRSMRASSVTKVGSSRKYQCVAIGKDQWAIKSFGNHKYVIAESGSVKGRLRAWAPKMGPKGTFLFKSVAKCSCFAIKAANKRFVTAHVNFKAANYGLLRAGAASVGTSEEFEIRGG
jgi:hypothetical protein